MPNSTYNFIKEVGGLRKPIRDLAAKIGQKIQESQLRKANARCPPSLDPALNDRDLPFMDAVSTYTSRELDQEIDAIEIIPAHPDYVVVGTYSLKEVLKSVDDTTFNSPAVRYGSLQILPFEAESESIPEHGLTELDRKDFVCAIVDLHFHPIYKDLLAVATSTGEIRFLNVLREYTADQSCSSFRFMELAIVPIYDAVDGRLPLITQFVWLPELENKVLTDKTIDYRVSLTACDSFGTTHAIDLNAVPNIRSSDDSRMDEQVANRTLRITSDESIFFHFVHKQDHDLEAWAVAQFQIFDHKTQEPVANFVLSGGDDQTFIASQYQLSNIDQSSMTTDSEPLEGNAWLTSSKVFHDRKSHTYGLTSILPLAPHPAYEGDNHNITPILTGCYDEHIRLFLFDRRTNKPNLVTEFQIIGGGIWKMALLDTYVVKKQLHYVLLISAMQTGARIVRLVVSTDYRKPEYDWNVEAVFYGHRSMVYGAVAKEVGGRWKVVSTSFYDKKVCGWEWVDDVKKRK